MSTITVMRPVADRPQPAGVLSIRPQDLRGLSVGFIDEGIVPPTRWTMAALERELVARAGIGRIVRVRLGVPELEVVGPDGVTLERVPTPGSPLEALVGRCDVAMTGVGYCGCSTWSVETALAVERQGIPTATIVGEEWAALAEATAREQGYDGLPLVVVPRAFERLARERIAALAADIADDVIHILSTPVAELLEEFRDRWASSAGVTVACSVRVPVTAGAGA